MLDYDFKSTAEMFRKMVPSFKDNSHRFLMMRFPFDPKVVEFVESHSKTRAEKRVAGYVIPGELERAALLHKSTSGGASIRFGKEKKGRGYVGKRRDFCLIGGALRGKTLTLFYRRLEMTGGLFYDLAIAREVDKIVGPVKHIVIVAVQANIYALGGGENLRFYEALRRYFK